MYLISKILWSQVFTQGNSEKFTISYQLKHEKFGVSPPPLPSLFLVLIYWLN